MLKQENRLKNDTDIKTLFAKGRSVFDINFGMKYKKNSVSNSRFAIVVGTKVSKSAVVRNKIKRRIRAVLEKHMPEMKPGFDVLIMVKKEALTQTFDQVTHQIEHMLKRAKLL